MVTGAFSRFPAGAVILPSTRGLFVSSLRVSGRLPSVGSSLTTWCYSPPALTVVPFPNAFLGSSVSLGSALFVITWFAVTYTVK